MPIGTPFVAHESSYKSSPGCFNIHGGRQHTIPPCEWLHTTIKILFELRFCMASLGQESNPDEEIIGRYQFDFTSMSMEVLASCKKSTSR